MVNWSESWSFEVYARTWWIVPEELWIGCYSIEVSADVKESFSHNM